MGTRGFVGFIDDDGNEKITYNHWDSYPSGLGSDVLTWLRTKVEREPATLRKQVGNLRMVQHDTPVTDEDLATLKRFHNGDVSTGDEREWYALLRNTQGDPALILEAGVAEDASGFPSDSLFCEWGYLIDLEQDRFEVYRGFQEQVHDEGRFADRFVEEERRGPRQYYPVRLVASWPLDALPTVAEFADLEREEDE